jgi:ASPM-SPD-2-Hydin domain-containing protein/centrosomal CEP192-like protein/HYDIN/CFA65/VesB family protein
MALTGCGAASKSSGNPVSSADSNSPAAIFSVSNLVFSSQLLNSTSPARTVTLTNTGNADLSLAGVSVSGNFAETTACPSSLPAGASCTISITFTPTAAGILTGAITLSDNAAASPQQVALSGTGVSVAAPAATVTPASMTFGSQVVNSTSPSDTVTLTNTGNASLSLASVTVTGNFAQTNNCGTSLAAGASCTVNVTFTPAAVGSPTGTLSFADNAPQSPQVVQLYGTGVTAGTLAANPASVSFGTVTVGQTGSQTLTITNSGGQNVIVTSASTSGAGLGLSGISTPLTLAPGQSSSFNVTYLPTSSGSLSGTVYLTNNSSTTSVAIPVSGTGAAASAAPQVVLEWTASSSPVIGYNTYRGTVSGGPYTKLTSSPEAQTSYTDQNVQAGDTYFYVVTAVGTNEAESGYSSQVEAIVPTS